MKKIFVYLLFALSGAIAAIYVQPTVAVAQPTSDSDYVKPYTVDSGAHDGFGAEPYVAFREVVSYPDAPWLQLHFSDYDLGQASYLLIRSQRDGAEQRLDAVTLPQWGDATAYFNGDAVEIELHVAPKDQGVFFRISEITIGAIVPDQPILRLFTAGLNLSVAAIEETLCGAEDDRIASADLRVGRIVQPGDNADCTVWLAANGSLLTAGHCRNLLVNPGQIEFNVQPSTQDGRIIRSVPNDQYPVDMTSLTVNNFENNGGGHDWAVFRVFPNSNTGLTPFQAYGFFRLTQTVSDTVATIRITGFGVDDLPPGPNPWTRLRNAANQTDQTHTGPLMQHGPTVDGGMQYHYVVDTRGANSGSPIIWDETGFALGIHTHGGCIAAGGANSGTSFQYAPLQDALQNFPGPDTVYVDGGITVAEAADGTVFRPFPTISEAVAVANSGAVLSVVTGAYTESITIDKPLTLLAPVGTVTIGAAAPE